MEIAELTGKRHDHVVRDIRTMLVELHGEGGVLSFEETLLRPTPSGGAARRKSLRKFRSSKLDSSILSHEEYQQLTEAGNFSSSI